MSGTFWKSTHGYSASEVCIETEGNELYQWRMCPAPGTGEAPVKAKQNRSSSVHFHSKTEQERDPEGTVSAATSSVCFLQNIRSMNQTSYLPSGPLLRLHLQPIPLLLWPNTITPPVSPLSSTSPPLSLLICPDGGRFFKGLWLPWWFSIKPL